MHRIVLPVRAQQNESCLRDGWQMSESFYENSHQSIYYTFFFSFCRQHPVLYYLLVIFLFFVSDGVELQLVLVLLDRNKSDPVSDLVLLQVSLGQVFQVLTGKLGVGNNNDLVTFLGNRDVVTQVTDNVVDLDVLNQVLDVTFLVENTVLNWSAGVNDKLLSSLSLLVGLSC